MAAVLSAGKEVDGLPSVVVRRGRPRGDAGVYG